MVIEQDAPWPPGYEAVYVDEITRVTFKRDTGEAIISFVSSTGQKVCLVTQLAQLSKAMELMRELAFESAKSASGGQPAHVALN